MRFSPGHIIFFLLALIAGACSAILPVPTRVDVHRAQNIWPFVDSTYLAEARLLYSQKCGGCHRAYPPSKFSLPEWERAFPEMAEEADLDSIAAKKIWIYIVTFQDTTTAPNISPHQPLLLPQRTQKSR